MKGLTCALVCTLVISATPARADVVLDWNAIAMETLLSQVPPVNPFFQARFLAITQLAVFEGVNAIAGTYEPYLEPRITAARGASAEAAAAAAAYRVLVTYFPGSAASLDAHLAASLAAIDDGPAKTAGIAAGEAAAQAMIQLRVGDGSAPMPLYVPTSALAGEWQLTPAPPPPAAQCVGGLFTQWPTLKPFGIHKVERFMPKPPPDLSSRRYARDYNEVMAVGGVNSTERSEDRAEVARFYAASSPSLLLNQAARQLAAAAGHSLAQNARTFALLSISVNDAFIVSFATKYTYNFWRPVTAIRLGDSDGNDRTVGDPTFSPYVVTPCFPAYPSNHASGTNGGLAVLRRIFGERGHALVLSNPGLGLSRQYTALKQISNDVDDARIYGGIHFRFDQEGGNAIGTKVGKWVCSHLLGRAHGGVHNE